MRPVATVEEVCILISAQLDMLEEPAPLNASQLVELHSRAETIRMLCQEMDQNEATLQAETDPFLVEDDRLEELRAQPLEFRTRRVRALAQPEAEDEQLLQLAAVA